MLSNFENQHGNWIFWQDIQLEFWYGNVWIYKVKTMLHCFQISEVSIEIEYLSWMHSQSLVVLFNRAGIIGWPFTECGHSLSPSSSIIYPNIADFSLFQILAWWLFISTISGRLRKIVHFGLFQIAGLLGWPSEEYWHWLLHSSSFNFLISDCVRVGMVSMVSKSYVCMTISHHYHFRKFRKFVHFGLFQWAIVLGWPSEECWQWLLPSGSFNYL